MDLQNVEKLIENCGEYDAAQLRVLYDARQECFLKYQTEKTSVALKDWKAAEDAFDACVQRVSAQKKTAAAFASVSDAVRFLQGQGYKVKKSKVYQDKKKGLLRSGPDGAISEDDALAYAVRAGLGKVSDAIGELDEYAGEKTRCEIERLVAKTEKLKFELAKDRGEYLLKDDVRLQIAVKLAALEAGIKNMVRVNATDWIYKVGGDPQKNGMFCELAYAEIDALLGEFGNMDEIRIVIVKDQER